MQKSVTKAEWVAMFRDIGLSEEQMHQWHRLFEQRHPDGHQEFLAWLGIAAAEITAIRKGSK